MNGAAAGVGVEYGEEGRARGGKVKWWEVIGG